MKKFGITKGKKAGKIEEKIDTAKKLLKLGIDIKTIVQATELSEEEIKKLKNS